MITIAPITGLGEIAQGSDLCRMLAERSPRPLAKGDILVVAQKAVSKAEGRLVQLCEVVPGEIAQRLAEKTSKDPRLVELILSESEAVLRAASGVLIVRHKLGFVLANAGIDQSNLGGAQDAALLLPNDPDRSAQELRAGLEALTGVRPAVIISDSFGRAWRVGTVNHAIGVAGMAPLFDQRGESDRDGRTLKVTMPATADAVAAAAGLAMGEAAEGIPAALVGGVFFVKEEGHASALVRPLEEDLFQ